MTNQVLTGDHWATFGDGNMAQIIESKEYIKKSGIRYVKFIVIPSTRIQDAFDILDRQDTVTGAIVVEYPWTDVIWQERSVARTRCIILTDFIGGSTPLSRRYEDLNEALLDTEKLIRSARAAKNRIAQELEQERQQQIQAMRTRVALVNEARKATSRMDGEDEDDLSSS